MIRGLKNVCPTSTTFESKAIAEVEKLLDKFIKEESISGMSNEHYIMICEQMGQEVDPSRLMTRFEDFPLIVQDSLLVYSKLPDNYVSRGMEGSTFIGKDYSSFKSICDLFNIRDPRDIRTALVVCSYIERKSVLKAEAAATKHR